MKTRSIRRPLNKRNNCQRKDAELSTNLEGGLDCEKEKVKTEVDSLEEQRKVYHINEFIRRMQYSSNSKAFRLYLFKSTTKAYEAVQQKKANEERSLHRQKEWKRKRRKKNKQRRENHGIKETKRKV